jgi:hypothetical protein
MLANCMIARPMNPRNSSPSTSIELPRQNPRANEPPDGFQFKPRSIPLH